MKILTKLLECFKAETPNTLMNTHYDPEKRLFIVGPDSKPAETLTAVPDGYHRCANLVSVKADYGDGFTYRRCNVFVDADSEYCQEHYIQPKDIFVRYCRWGPCKVKLYTNINFCELHSIEASKSPASRPGWYVPEAPPAVHQIKFDDEFESIEESRMPIDWGYASRIGYGTTASRLLKKRYVMENMHFRLALRGTRDEIDLFHAVVHTMDHDYPLDPFRKRKDSPAVCAKCQCTIWEACILTPGDLKKAAKQCGIYVKVQQYVTEEKCTGKKAHA